MTDIQITRRPFGGRPVAEVVAELTAEIRELYTSDQVPWVIGYSGGKDSTAVLQLVWLALNGLAPEERTKPVHVISTDTLVENPVVATWVSASLKVMTDSAQASGLPIFPHRLTPTVEDTFWVNLIGKGYPAPRPKFRWCTERLKIKPSNAFIRSVVRDHGEAILVLGIRKAESSVRASVMAKHARRRVRDRLSPNGSLPNSLVYSPIEDWTNDEVWMFLMQVANPWGYRNKDLLTMYQGASTDGECPLVVDSTTPSCGDSRFGCWTCTLVDKDKSMSAMIQNDDEKEWMLPLLELRNALDMRDDEGFRDDRVLRDWRRMNGRVQLMERKSTGELEMIHGPYTQQSREEWLRKLLGAQAHIRENGPEGMGALELVSLDELHEIRRIWVFEKHEIEDSLPHIYAEVTGGQFPGKPLDEHLVLSADDVDTLRQLCDGDELRFEMTRSLLAVEQKFRTRSRRSGLFEELEKVVRHGFYDGRDDAGQRARAYKEVADVARGYRPMHEAPATGHMTVDDQAATGAGLSPLFEADEAEQQLEGTHASS
ncbi:DNA sulfur modification protein DndC [Friedmanniella luteola]|uniref:DNA sulfur modification protein DndC n=1 Tax=Friedmanniella luteola TaxID=546871 RepID=A0A1H1ZM09_9ACTN|nr:DNA phosphorothioation system sulfurtransferase DndC [Friedmanniella luteola]SDT34851.1 DNA sulfur modification protein DndC [Friedmanniella luteola]